MSGTLLYGHVFGNNFGDDLMMEGLLWELGAGRNDRVRVLASRRPPHDLSGVDVVARSLGSALAELRHSSRFVLAGGTHLCFLGSDSSLRQLRILCQWVGLAALARATGSAIEMRAVGIGPFQSRWASLLGRLVLSMSKSVTVRDVRSLETCVEWGVPARFERDLAYAAIEALELDSTRDEHGLFVAPAANNFTLQWYTSRILDFHSRFPSEPVVVFASSSNGSLTDTPVAAEIVIAVRSARPSINIVSMNYSGVTADVVDAIRKSRCVLAARYHVVMTALAVGKPVEVDAYHTKVAMLIEHGSSGGFGDRRGA